MKTATSVYGLCRWVSGGLDGGGYVTSIFPALDGTFVCRNDTANAHIRRPGDKNWTELFRAGDNVPDAQYRSTYQITQRVYDIGIAEQDSYTIYGAWLGFLWKTTDGAVTPWTKLTGFKGTSPDTNLMWAGSVDQTRFGGQHLRVDPFDKNTVLFGHPYEGVYLTTDGGTTFGLIPGLPAPTTSQGVDIVFDRFSGAAANGRCTRVAVTIYGRGTYVTTTTATGTWTLSPGGPTASSAMDWSNGKLFVTGNGLGNVAPIHVLSDGAWSDVGGGRQAMGLAVHPKNQNLIGAVSVGGANHISTDGGVTWNTTDNFDNVFDSDDVPWLSYTSHSYLSLGAVTWDPLQAMRLEIANGIGTWYLDNPPANGNTKWRSTTLGIKQILVMGLRVTPKGSVLAPVQDRGIFCLTRENAKRQATRHGPATDIGLQFGCGADYAADNPDHYVVTRAGVGNNLPTIWQSYNAGVDWTPLPNIPTTPSLLQGGNIAMGVSGNILCCGTSDGPFRGTLDSGATWFTPKFAGITNIDLSTFHHAYSFRRDILVNDKEKPERFFAYCVGTRTNDPANNPQDPAGLWESNDSGRNFVRVHLGYIEGLGQDEYHAKLRKVPGYNHLLWVRGISDGYPTPPAANGFLISVNGGATFEQIPGWAAPEDVAIGPNPLGGYPVLYVIGWRGTQHGVWMCLDFNPTTRAGTWQLLTAFPMGHGDENCLIACDPVQFGRLYFVPSAGGLLVGDILDVVQGT